MSSWSNLQYYVCTTAHCKTEKKEINHNSFTLCYPPTDNQNGNISFNTFRETEQNLSRNGHTHIPVSAWECSARRWFSFSSMKAPNSQPV